MEKQGFKRKLTAILSADVEGYSRLMGDDEEATVQTITAYREVITTLIQQHNGKVVDSPGDNLMAEFVSVVDAVQCAVSVQKEIKARNEELSENRRMQFRIGINLGDVIQEEERIYGDGVNIAARLEGLAEAGGICISKTAFDHIESKLPYGYEFLGDQPVKNIARPVGAYRVLMEPRVTVAGEVENEKAVPMWRRKSILVGGGALVLVIIAGLIWNFYFQRASIEPASVDKMAYPLPDKPSIAVLPFDNLSGDSDQDFISDGISENIISALSKIGEIFVIARNSTFTYKGRPVKIQQIAEDLGVRYIIEGSVQKSGDKIRVTAQLIDAISGYHLWSEKYDRDIIEFFDILDEITLKIVIALQAKLTHGEQVQRWYGTTNFEAWSYMAKGWSIFENYTKANNERSRHLFEQALKVDPHYAFALLSIAFTHVVDARFAFTKSPSESLNQAYQFGQKAQARGDKIPELHALWNTIYLFQRQHKKAIAEGQKSIELDPNSALSHILFAQTMYYAGNFHEAVDLAEQSVRLSPYCPAWYMGILNLCYRHVGRYQDAIRTLKILLDRTNKDEYTIFIANAQLATTYGMMGQYEKAKPYTEKAIEINPNWSLEWVRKINVFFKDQTHVDKMVNTARKVGLK